MRLLQQDNKKGITKIYKDKNVTIFRKRHGSKDKKIHPLKMEKKVENFEEVKKKLHKVVNTKRTISVLN